MGDPSQREGCGFEQGRLIALVCAASGRAVIEATIGADKGKGSDEAGILGCRAPQMVTKELWVHLLGYNLVRLLMVEAAQSADCQARDISFRHAQQSWVAWVLLGAPLDEPGWQRLLERIAFRRVRQRPGRREPRAVKRRPKPRVLLDLPRDIARICHHAYERKRR